VKHVAAWPALAAYAVVFVGGIQGSQALVLAVARQRAAGDAERVAAEATRFALSLPGLAAVAGLDAALLTLAAVVTASLSGVTFAHLGLQRGRASAAAVATAIVGAVALSAACSETADLAGLGQGPVMNAIADAVSTGPALAMVALAVVPGFAEELFFRGLMQTRLANALGPWPAIVVASAAFGALHLDPVQGTVAFVVGMWLGWVTQRYESLWPAIAAHVVNNAVFLGLALRSARA
jgi:membrane protease YdiL (CAAX protease family)